MTWVRAPWAVAIMTALILSEGAALASPPSQESPVRPTEDPVLQARAQRASAKGIAEDDLPPVPRSIMEPPPLPPPELHPRDMKGSRATRAARKGGRSAKARTSKKGRSPRGRRAKSPR